MAESESMDVDPPITAVGQSKDSVDCGFEGPSAEESTFSYVNVNTVAAKMDSNIGLKLHEALCNVEKCKEFVCFVPYTTWNQFQQRFQRNVVRVKHAFMFVITKFMSKVYEYIRTFPEQAMYFDNKEYIASDWKVRVYGAQGIGKSAAMYVSYCALRGQRDKYRVTLIGDCAEWIVADMPIRFVLIELVQTFYDDFLPNLNDSAYPYYQRAHEWATWVEKAGLGEAEMRLMKFITVLFKYTRDKGLTWFMIIDQQNALHTKGMEDKGGLCFRIINRFSRLRGCFIVFGASANNEEWQKKQSEYEVFQPELHVDVRFSEEQVVKYLANLSIKYQGRSLEQYSDLIFTSSEGIPLEVDKFVNTFREHRSFDEIQRLYHENRSEQFMVDCSSFFEELNVVKKATYKATLVKILGHMPCEKDDYNAFDKRMVMCRVPTDDSSSTATRRVKAVLYLEPTCQFARRALEKLFMAGDLGEFCRLTEANLKEDYPNFIKFGVVERYIIKMMSFRPFEIKPKHCNKDKKNFVASNGYGDASDYAIKVVSKDTLSVRHFVGGYVPDVVFENKLTLYVPDSSTYKGFDVFLFVPKNSAKEARLYAYQITGASNVDQHIASDITSIAPKPSPKTHTMELRRDGASKLAPPLHQREWAKYCKIDATQVIPVWLTKVKPKPVGGDL